MQGGRVKTLTLPVVHRRRVSDGGDINFDRSPRIVEMDTCQLRCRSSRITSRYAADPPPDGTPGSVPLSSPHLYCYKPPPSRHLQAEEHEHDARRSRRRRTTRPGSPPRSRRYHGPASPAKGRVVSPRYMADTASSVARARCQSAPRQRHGAAGEPRPSLARAGSRKSRPDSAISLKSSEMSRHEDSEFSDDVTRDYYLDQLW